MPGDLFVDFQADRTPGYAITKICKLSTGLSTGCQ